jgi:hypothetical protein
MAKVRLLAWEGGREAHQAKILRAMWVCVLQYPGRSQLHSHAAYL